MKKVSKSNKTPRGSKTTSEKRGEGKFTFLNGDSYVGEYIVVGNKEIYRHGYGVYKTSDSDEYRATWDKDAISSNLHIVYGNKAEYKGEINSEGAMNGKGTYIFPDRMTSLSATWKDNQPFSDIIYSDPLGHKWGGKLSSCGQEVIFSPENPDWRK